MSFSPKHTLFRTTHEKTVLIAQANQQTSFNSTQETQNISIRVHTGSSKERCSHCLLSMAGTFMASRSHVHVHVHKRERRRTRGSRDAAPWPSHRGELCFCRLEGRGKRKSGVCCSHFPLLYQETLSYLGLAAAAR